jgi:hypothetical protein
LLRMLRFRDTVLDLLVPSAIPSTIRNETHVESPTIVPSGDMSKSS